MTSYSRSIVTIVLSRTVSEISSISVENRQLFLPRVLNSTDEGVPLGIWYRRKGSRMLLGWGYQMVEKVLR